MIRLGETIVQYYDNTNRRTVTNFLSGSAVIKESEQGVQISASSRMYRSAIWKRNASGTECYAVIFASVSCQVSQTLSTDPNTYRIAYCNVQYGDVYSTFNTNVAITGGGKTIYALQTSEYIIKANATNINANIPVFEYSQKQDFIDYVTSQSPPQYTWSSVPSISGKNGILSFTALKNNLITGDAQTGLTSEDFTQIIDSTKISALSTNIPVGSEQPVIYAGQVDYMSIKAVTNATKKLTFHVGINTYDFNVLAANFNAWLCFIIDEEQEVAKAVLAKQYIDGTAIRYNFTPNEMTDDEMHLLWLFLHGHSGQDDYTPEDINDSIPDGNSIQPFQDTEIEGLTAMTKSAINTGFTTMYKVTEEELQGLSAFLWSDNFLNNVKKFFNDPREIIVGIAIMPISPDTEETSSHIGAGGIDTNVLGYKLTSQFKIENYGEIEITDKSFTRKFLNFPPFTKITAHLPFVGEHSLDVNDVMGHKLTLKYAFDFLSGSCVAEIDKDGKPRYFFGGSCGIQIPTSSEDFGRMYSGILSAGATLGSTLATIATGGLSAPLMLTAGANMISNGVNMTPNVNYSSGSGSINGMLSAQTAFLVVETPIDKIADKQASFVGKPSLIKKLLSDCSGFIKCYSVHLDNINCLVPEREEIEKALSAGVRIESGSSTPSYTPTAAGDFGLIFLKLESDFNVIGKSWSQATGDINTIEGKIVFDKDILNPTFLIDGDITGYNYCYIPAFNRFYYISLITAKSSTLYEVKFNVDVLQSHSTAILSNYVVLERAEEEYNTYFNDNMVWTQQNKKVAVVPFLDTRTGKEGEQLKFARTDNSYILTIAGAAPVTP